MRSRVELRIRASRLLDRHVAGPVHGNTSRGRDALVQLFDCKTNDAFMDKHAADQTGRISTVLQNIIEHGLPMYLMYLRSKDR